MSSPVSILLVDDQPRNLDVLEALLDAPDYRLVRAESADASLLALLEEEFAAIVLDVKMPGMDGVELAQLIKRRPRTRHIPILFLTAHLQEEKDILLAYGAGGVDYLSKPINPQVLRSKIAVFAELFRKTRQLAAANSALEAEIAERQKAQEALRQANEELEARVQRRTADLTRINRSLGESEQRLRVALEGAITIAFTWDVEQDEVRRYHSTDPVLGPNPDTPDRFADVLAQVHPEDQENFAARMRECMAAADGRYKNEYRVVHPDNSVHWLEEWGTFLRDEEGRPRRLTGLSMDVTERKQISQALEQAKADAEAANEAKDHFLAVLSHELRTPLTPVLMTVQLLEKDASLKEDVREALATVRRNVELEARLIDDLLDLTLVSRGKLALNLQDVDLHVLVRQAMEICSPEAEEKGVRLVLDAESAKSRTRGDPARLQQVFWNLIKNAVKFTPADGEVRICCRDEQADGSDRVAVSVRDTGVGINPQLLSRVFDAFEQGDRAKARQFGGLGLGLAISKALVDVHGGVITADSPGEGQGAAFTVSLPAAAHIDKPSRRPKLRADGKGQANHREPFLHVLLVEDHVDSARVLVRLLGSSGYKVTHAENVASALRIARQTRFDLLISDLGLPDGSGHDLIRQLAAERPVSGIALSGYGMETDIACSRKAGFLEHLTKPVTLEQLESAIQRVVDQSS